MAVLIAGGICTVTGDLGVTAVRPAAPEAQNSGRLRQEK